MWEDSENRGEKEHSREDGGMELKNEERVDEWGELRRGVR